MFWPILIASLSFWSVALAGALILGRRYVRAIEARQGDQLELADLRERIAALEATVGERPALSSGTVAEPPSLPRGGAAR